DPTFPGVGKGRGGPPPPRTPIGGADDIAPCHITATSAPAPTVGGRIPWFRETRRNHLPRRSRCVPRRPSQWPSQGAPERPGGCPVAPRPARGRSRTTQTLENPAWPTAPLS